MRYTLIFLFLITLFNNNNTMQKRELIKSIWVLPPIIGAYNPVPCPTYITPTIYFEGTADLVGSYEPTISKFKINDQEKELIKKKQKPMVDLFFSRHPQITRSIVYDEQHNIESFKLVYTNEENEKVSLSWNSSNKKITFNTKNISKKGRVANSFIDKNNNIHTIQEEKFQIPIFNLIFGNKATFLIRYYDVQLTEIKNGEQVRLKPWPKIWHIFTHVLNEAFMLFFIYIVCNKINNYL